MSLGDGNEIQSGYLGVAVVVLLPVAFAYSALSTPQA
jgi:hypothetical protein